MHLFKLLVVLKFVATKKFIPAVELDLK